MTTSLQFLGLPEDADEETASLAMTAMLTAAVHDEANHTPLSDIFHQVTTSQGSQYLDPLQTVPLLIACTDPKAQDLLAVIGECCSAKETLIATQECMERLTNSLQRDPEENEENEDPRRRAPIEILVAIIQLYTASIPRLKLRNKSALETIRSHLEELVEAIDAAAFNLKAETAPAFISSVSHLADKVYSWLNEDPRSTKTELLIELLEHALLPSSRVLESSIAERTFLKLNPRFKRPGSQVNCQEADEALSTIFTTFSAVGYTPPTPSETSLISLAHLQVDKSIDSETLASFLPLIIACIHSNLLLDEALAVLLRFTATAQSITDEVAGPLVSVLPELASGHPDPQFRHLAFRILSRVLALTPPPLRMQILADLTSNSDFPQLRVAAVGLVKEALLEALIVPDGNPFASHVFLRTFSQVLFRPILDAATLDEFEESQEPKRLVECLSLYYVLLERDGDNLTGIRDAGAIKSVEDSLISPLRSKMNEWEGTMSGSNGHEHDHHFNPLLPLHIALERVEETKTKLNL